MAWAQAINALHPHLLLAGKQVMTLVVKTIWNYVLDLWKLQNNHLHQHAAQLNLPNYWQAIINLYEQCPLIPPEAQEALYQQPLEILLEQPTPRLQMWAMQGLKYFNQQIKVAKTQATLRTPDIRQFFQPKTQQHNDLQPP